jgi:hypothetical protein
MRGNWLTHQALFLVSTLVALLAFQLQLKADELSLTATVGVKVRVYGHVRFADDCSQGPIPEMTIVTKPALGVLTTQTEMVTLTSPDFGTCSAGHSGMGTVVYYEASAAGQDNFEYKMSSPGLPTTDWKVSAEVH